MSVIYMNNNTCTYDPQPSQGLIECTEQNPCPHCGNKKWCYSIGELSVCKKNAPPAKGWYETSKYDLEGSKYYAPVTRAIETKPIRPKQSRCWEYPTRDNLPLIRVKRNDDGEGKKFIWQEYWIEDPKLARFRTEGCWVLFSNKRADKMKALEEERNLFRAYQERIREKIPIYRYAEIIEAIAQGHTIYIVEGEVVADALWELGIAATTNIGGSGKWKPSDTKDLEGAKVVLVPDRDQPGLKHMLDIAEHFPNAQWLFPFPNSSAWNNLPKSEGVDIADWIADYNLTAEDIHAQEGNKPSDKGYSAGIGGNQQQGLGGSGSGGDDGGNIISFPGVVSLNLEQIIQSVDYLINEGLTGSQLTGQLNQLATNSRFSATELRKLYYERLGEAELEGDRPDNKAEVERLLGLGQTDVNLNDYLPTVLAEPLNRWCGWLAIKPSTVLTALLTGTSSLHKVGTELVIHRAQSFTVPPTLYGALVSDSGQRKSPVFDNIIRKPLWVLGQEKQDARNAAMQDYQAELEAWEKNEKKGEKPKAPPPATLYYFTNATGEAISSQATKDPEKALFGLIDELAGLFNSANAYRQGKGSDKQDLLSFFDGRGQTVLRAGEGIRTNLAKIYLSLFGTIQPGVLRQFMGDCQDPDGSWARFLFVNQPLEAATLSDDNGETVQISDRISWFYRKIDQLPEMEYCLSHAAFKRYQPVYNQLERLRVTHHQPGMRAVFSKMEGGIGRLAINLHVLWELANGKEIPDAEIPLFIMEMAIQLAKFYIGQVELIYAHSGGEDLAPHVAKMIELSKRLEANGKDGWLTARVLQQLTNKAKKLIPDQCREWMREAVRMGYGQIQGIGNRLKWFWRPPDQTVDAVDTVDKPIYNPEPPNTSNFNQTVDAVDTSPPDSPPDSPPPSKPTGPEAISQSPSTVSTKNPQSNHSNDSTTVDTQSTPIYTSSTPALSESRICQIVSEVNSINSAADWREVESRYPYKELLWVFENVLTAQERRRFSDHSIL